MMNNTTISVSAPVSPLVIPWSIACLASGAGASAAAVPRTRATIISAVRER
jgi:hypothetical protein